MSPPLPEPEQIPWYLWVLGVLTAAVGGLSALLVGRFFRQVDNTDQNLRDDLKEVNQHLADHGDRITHLETGSVTQEYVHDVVTGVIRDFHRDQGRLEATLGKRIIESETRTTERVTETVAACNNALRSEMRVLTESSDKRFDAISNLLRDLLRIVSERRDERRESD